MQFLQPNYLWALGALAIPIAIHLFNFQRRRRVYFSNVALLEQVEQSTSAMRKLKHYLVLALRMLAITALVLAFAQPVLKNEAPVAVGQGDISLWIDNSPSTLSDNGNGPALDRAVLAAEKLIGQYSNLNRFQVLDNGFSGADAWFYGKKQSLKRLRGLKEGYQVRTGKEVITRQNASLNRENGVNKEVWWFGDFQKNLNLEAEDLPLENGIKYHWVPLENGKPSNISIDSAWLDSPVLKVGATQVLKVKVVNRSEKGVPEVQVRFLIEDKLVGSSAASLSFGETKVLTFNFSLPENKAYQGRLELNDQPIVFDNQRFLVFQPLPKVKVVWVTENSSQKMVDALFGNKELFELTQMSFEKVSLIKLSTADLIVAEVGAKTDLSIFKVLLNKGPSFVFYPVAGVGNNYAKALVSLVSVPIKGIDNRDTSKLSGLIEYPEKGQPFFEGVFENMSKNPLLPYSQPIVDIDGGLGLLKYKNRKNYLTQVKNQNYQVFIFSGALENGNNGLSRHGLFVPVFYRLAFSSLKNLLPLSFSVNSEVIKWPLKGNTAPKKIEWVGSKQKITPGFRVAGSMLLVDVPKAEVQVGVYRVVIDGVNEGFIAFNTRADEGQMRFYSESELKLLAKKFPNLKIESTIENSGDIQALVSDLGAKKWWPYFVLATILFLVSEILVMKFIPN